MHGLFISRLAGLGLRVGSVCLDLGGHGLRDGRILFINNTYIGPQSL